jgi:type VI secretion system protein ImpJ
MILPMPDVARANAPLRKPLWPPSGKLRPQNLQFVDEYAERFACECFDALAWSTWGIARIVIANEALEQGVFQVSHLEGRFPSGAPLVVSPRNPLTRRIDSSGESILVSAAIPKAASDAPNAADDASESAGVRYLRARSDRFELYPNVRLLFGAEGGDAYERITLARLHPQGRIHLDPWTLPPMTRLLSGTVLASEVGRVVSSLRARRNGLIAARKARPFDLRTVSAALMPEVLLLSIINQALAVLDHPDLTAHLPPPALHQVLTELLGGIETLGGTGPTLAVPYRHAEPGANFRALIERLLIEIPRVAREPHQAFPLARVDDATFALEVRDPELFRRRVYLVASGADESWLATSLPAHAKIASDATLPAIVNSATRGVSIALEFDPPPSLPSSARHCSFRIDTRSNYWTNILERKALRIRVLGAPRELVLSLYVLTGDAP